MKNHKHLIVSIGSTLVFLIGIVLMVQTQTPDQLGPAGVALFFMLMYGLVAQIISVFLVAFSYTKSGTQLRFAERLTLSLASALPIMMLVALNTIRPLGLIDFSLSLIFGIVLVFYLKRR